MSKDVLKSKRCQQVGVWPKCVCVVKVCGQSVCMCVWPKSVQGSSGWVVKWVVWQAGGGSSRLGVKWVGVMWVCAPSVCVWSVCGQSVCMCVWPRCVQGSSGWVVMWVGGQVGGRIKWVGVKLVCCLSVCVVKVCVCVWPKCVWVLNGWVVK